MTVDTKYGSTDQPASNATPEEETKVAEEFILSLKKDTLRLKNISLEELYTVQLNSGSTLLSAESFEKMGLDKELLKAIYVLGIEKPSIIQQLAIPHILAEKNAVFQSRSGTGKTIAFAIGSLSRAVPGDGPQVVILTPTRELCNQVADVIEGLASAVGLKVCRALRNFVATSVSDEIIVGCPGKILSFLSNKIINPESIKLVVLDEADELISYQVFSAQTLRLLKSFSKAQKVLFSATYSEFSQRAATKFVPGSNTFFEKNTAAEQIRFYNLDLDTQQRIEGIKEMLCYVTVAQTIIFCNSRSAVERVTKEFKKDNYSVSSIHGGMEPAARDESFYKFSRAETKILVATDVFARGMDIPQVNLIINFELPRCEDDKLEESAHTYIHRVGRSGRFNRPGFVVDVVDGLSCDLLKKIHELSKIESGKLTLEALKKAFEKHELMGEE